MPGTDVRKTLRCLQTREPDVVVIALEDALDKLAAPYVRKLFGLEPTKLSKFLLPRPLLRRLWCEAFQAQWTLVQAALAASQHTIFTLHLCYFHQLTREYLAVADLRLIETTLADHQNATWVILIDDIYDCYHRLSDYRGFFDPPGSADEAVLDLLDILDWRSIEIVLSQAAAAASSIKSYLFAVKHPLGTLRDLFYSGKPVAYHSHPIAEPRRTWNDEKVPDKSDVRAIVAAAADFSSRLNAGFTVIQPTCIDELRIAANGLLSARWPFERPIGEMGYSPPEENESMFMLPLGWQEDRRTAGSVSQALVTRLTQAISKQIDARDHTLVEQADCVICYRPLYHGNPSGGVREELQHLGRLMLISQGDYRPALVYNPIEDQRLYAPRQFRKDTVPQWRKSGLLLGTDEKYEGLLQDLHENNAQLAEVLRGGEQELQKFLYRHGLTIAPTETGRVPSSTLGATREVRRDERAQHLAHEVRALQHPYTEEFSSQGFITLFDDVQKLYKTLDV